MKYLVIGDPHCKLDNLDKIQALFDIAESYGAPVIWLGDFLDTKDVVRARCLNLIYNNLKKSKLRHIILIGNHDLVNLTATEHSLETLKALENVTIVDDVYREPGLLFVPYMHDVEALKKKLKDHNKKCPEDSVLFCHADLVGFNVGNGHISEQGLTLKDLKGFKKVISGHYHTFQQKENVTYLGTPFSHNFGESNETKYVGVFDSLTVELKLVETDFPRHISFEWDLGTDLSTPGSLDRLIKSKSRDGDFVRVLLRGTEEQLLGFPRERYPAVKFIEKVLETGAREASLLETTDNKTQFLGWCKAANIEPSTIDVGLQILEEALH